MKLEFTIYGNPKDAGGNPMPKIKLTERQHWMPRAQAYKAWKTHVRATLLEAVMKQVVLKRSEVISALYSDKAPFDTSEKPARMDLEIRWKDKAHGDPENVFGSIADALFNQDKQLNGSFNAEVSPLKKGYVRVTIQQ